MARPLNRFSQLSTAAELVKGNDLQNKNRSFHWGQQEPLQAEQDTMLHDEAFPSSEAPSLSLPAQFNMNSGNSCAGTRTSMSALKEVALEVGPQGTPQRREVSAEEFGERDSVRITAPVAAQHDVDAVAKTLRKSGAYFSSSVVFLPQNSES